MKINYHRDTVHRIHHNYKEATSTRTLKRDELHKGPACLNTVCSIQGFEFSDKIRYIRTAKTVDVAAAASICGRKYSNVMLGKFSLAKHKQKTCCR
jgi:hypothetical protein